MPVSDESSGEGGDSGGVPVRFFKALKWLATSIGVSGLFIATGFLIDTAYQDRLGFDVGRSGEILHLTIEAGRFFVDLVLISFTALADHPIVTVVAAVPAILAITGPGRRVLSELRRKVAPRAPQIPWLLPLLLLLEMGLFDVPMMGLRGMLVHGLTPPDNLNRQTLVRPLALRAWQDEVCSRLSQENVEKLTELTLRCPFSQEWHRERLTDRFTLNLFLTFGLSGWAIGQAQRRRSQGSAAHRGQTVALLLAVLNLVLLPYSYGKSMRSTFVGEVVMSRKDQEPVHGLLLHRSPDTFVLFEKSELQIWVVPEQEIGLVRIEGESDVIDFFVNKKLESVPSATEEVVP